MLHICLHCIDIIQIVANTDMTALEVPCPQQSGEADICPQGLCLSWTHWFLLLPDILQRMYLAL